MKFRQGLQALPDLFAITEASGKRLYRLPSGDFVPSITTILSHFDAPMLADWRSRVGIEEANKISKQAADLGSTVHDMVERHIKGETLDRDDYMPDEWIIFKKFEFEVLQFIDEVWYMEQTLYSPSLKVAGRCDLVCEHRFFGPILIDWKTTKDVSYSKDKYLEQVTCYSLMLEEVTGIKVKNFLICYGSYNYGGQFSGIYSDRTKYINRLKSKIKAYHESHPLCLGTS